MNKRGSLSSGTSRWFLPSPFRNRRSFTAVGLGLIFFHLIQAVLLLPINQILCLDGLNASKSSTVAAPHDHDHDHDHDHGPAAPASATEPEGDQLQHCKDTLFGIALIPVQPFSLPMAVSLHEPAVSWAAVPAFFEVPIERSSEPPLPPPRV